MCCLGDMRHERNVLCDMHCNMMWLTETCSRTRRDEHKCLELMGAVLLVWTIMTKANGRFRLQLLCLFHCWFGKEQIFPSTKARCSRGSFDPSDGAQRIVESTMHADVLSIFHKSPESPGARETRIRQLIHLALPLGSSTVWIPVASVSLCRRKLLG